MSDIPKCTSREYWWPTLRNIAHGFEQTLIKNYEGGQLDEQKFEEALKIYETGWWRFKEYVYRKKAKAERIDIHKIIAIYILSFLKTEPFCAGISETKDDGKEHLFLANEDFCLAITLALISAKAGRDEIFQISKSDKDWFIILLKNLNLKLKESNRHIISPDNPSDMVEVLSLSQIIYYIEKSYISPNPTPQASVLANQQNRFPEVLS